MQLGDGQVRSSGPSDWGMGAGLGEYKITVRGIQKEYWEEGQRLQARVDIASEIKRGKIVIEAVSQKHCHGINTAMTSTHKLKEAVLNNECTFTMDRCVICGQRMPHGPVLPSRWLVKLHGGNGHIVQRIPRRRES